MNCRQLAKALVFGFIGIMVSPVTYGQSIAYPTRPITLVVGFAAGGGTDAVGRLLATALTAKLGQQVLVDNKAGANTIIATQYVRSRPADGYTLLLTSASFVINPALQKLNFDIYKDFTSVALVDTIPLLLVANNDVPAKSVRELIALARSQKGKLTYASFGSGSASHLAAEQFAAMTGTEMIHVPYKGSAPALVDVMGGQVSIMMPAMGPAVSLAKEGKLRALAVTSSKRATVLPEVPTLAEAGVPGFEVMTWETVQAPAGTPPEIVTRLNTAIREALATPDLRDQLLKLGVEPESTKTPSQVDTFIRQEGEKFGKLARERNIKID